MLFVVNSRQRSVQQKRKGNEPLQGMHLVADQRCTPFAEAFRGLTAMTYRAAQRTSVTLEPFSMLHIRPLQNGLDTVEAALGRLFERGVDDSQQPGSHQTLILELPKVAFFNALCFVTRFHRRGRRCCQEYVEAWAIACDHIRLR